MPLVPWLRAALVGPCISVTFIVTLVTLVQPVGEGQSRFFLWLTSMAYGGVLASLSVGALVAVDWSLFKANVRKLPTGRRAWLTSLGMPLAVTLVYQMLSPGDDLGPGWFAALVIPAFVVAGVLRFTLSEPMG